MLLHLVGSAVHLAYLSQWGIDTGLFPKSGEWLVIMGYYGIWNALATATLTMLKYWYVVILSGIGLAFYLWLLFSPWNVEFHRSLTLDFHRILTHPVCEQRSSRCG